ncbi:KS-MAT linker domain-containing protein, partial [Streptomyces sp. NPDC002454]
MAGIGQQFGELKAPPVREPETGAPRLVTLSALDDRGLARRRADLRRWLARHPGARLDDIALSLNLGRRAMERRWAVVVSDTEELAEALAAEGGGRVVPRGGRAVLRRTED